MIIDCPACRARFRLDEAKIKGRGARVRCRRCGESIVVLKPGKSQDAETGAGTLDLHSVVRDSFEDGAAPPPSPPDVTSAGGKDEIDLAFDKILFSGKAEESPPSRDADPGELAIDFRPDEKVDLTGDRSEAEESPKEAATSDFMVSDSDTLDLLKKEYGKQIEDGPEEADDISGSLRQEPVIPLADEEMTETPLPSPVHTPTAAEPEHLPPRGYEEQMNELTVRTDDYAPPPQPPETPHAIEPIPLEPPEQREPASPVSRPYLTALLLVFLVLSGGGAYLGFTKGGQDLLRSLFPGLESLLPRGGAKSVPQFDFRNLIGLYELDTNSGNLFVIKGEVGNAGRTRKSGIKIRAALLDEKDRIIGETSCYAGNVPTQEMLRTDTRVKIEGILLNRLGDRLVNVEIPPGKSVPFMIVFFDAPEEVSAYRLEAKEGE